MQAKLLNLATRYAGRPILMEGNALELYAQRLLALDARALERPSRFGAILRKLSMGRPLAMDDEDTPPAPLHQRLAYAPRYIGEPDDAGYCWSLKDGIALLAVTTPLLEEGEDYCGVVYHGYDTLLAGFRDAAANARVAAIFLKLQSPGGVAAGSLLTLSEWMRANRGASGGKPIWCFAQQACSAAYWIAAQCDRIAATPMSYVGSIGAYTVHEDLQGLYEQAGVKITEFKAFARKTDGAPWKGLSSEAAADIQSDIEQCVRDFVTDVSLGRAQLTPETIAGFESRVFTARHDDAARDGLKLGLVDELSSEEAFYAKLRATISGTAETFTIIAGAGVRAASDKEQPMATTTASDKTARAAEKTKLKAALSRIKAEEAEEAAAEQPAAQPAGNAEDNPENRKDSPEAAKIAASEEAKKHPHLAMAAIRSGQSLAQFKANVEAEADAPKAGALARLLEGSPRLGPDGGIAKAATPIDTGAIYAERRKAGRR